MTDSCRTCEWAYLRREFSRDWNYEACALGIMPMIPYLPDDARCHHHKRRSEEGRKLDLHDRPSFMEGQWIEL